MDYKKDLAGGELRTLIAAIDTNVTREENPSFVEYIEDTILFWARQTLKDYDLLMQVTRGERTIKVFQDGHTHDKVFRGPDFNIAVEFGWPE